MTPGKIENTQLFSNTNVHMSAESVKTLKGLPEDIILEIAKHMQTTQEIYKLVQIRVDLKKFKYPPDVHSKKIEFLQPT